MVMDNIETAKQKNDVTTIKKTKSFLAPYKSFILLGSLFLISLIFLYCVYLSFPKLQEYVSCLEYLIIDSQTQLIFKT